MYSIKGIDNYNVYLKDIRKMIRCTGPGTLVTDMEYNTSTHIQNTADKLVITRVSDDEDYNSRQEIIYSIDGSRIITLINGEYTPDANNIFIYVNGEILNKSEYVETSSTTIEILRDIPPKSIIFVRYTDGKAVYELPTNSTIIGMFEQEIDLPANQQSIIFTRPLKDITKSIFLIYMDGTLIPRSSYSIINNNEIRLFQALNEPCEIFIICFEYDIAEFSTSVSKKSNVFSINPAIPLESFSSNTKKVDNLKLVEDYSNKNLKEVKKNAKSKILGWFSMGRSRR